LALNAPHAHEVLRAQEIIITLPAPLPDDLLACLAARSAASAGIAPAPPLLLCHRFTDPGYLLSLLKLGFQVFTAEIPDEMLIFFDRQMGYRLPDWERLPQPFHLACRLLWARTGAFTWLEGRVASVETGRETTFRLLTLTGHAHVRIAWRQDDGPQVGEMITVLGHQHFTLGVSLPILIEAIALWSGEAVRR